MEKTPPEGKSLRKSKLDGQDLRQRDLRGADLTSSSLANADLSGLDLTGAILNKANLRDAKLDGANLSGVEAKELQARGTWEKVIADGADLTGLLARKLEFNDCRFTRVNFSRANLRRVVFRRCTIDNCDFTEATAPDVSFLDCQVTDSKLVRSDLSCPTIKNTTFAGCSFTHSDLSGAVINGVSISKSDLTKADFIAGEFENVTLQENILAKANFRYARGLSEEQNAQIRAAGGRASRGWTRKAMRAVFGTWPGRIAFVVVAAGIIFAVVSHKMNPEYWPFDRLMQSATAKREARDFNSAIRFCNIMLRKHCDDKIRCAMIKAELARTYQTAGKTNEAIKYFSEVLAYDTLDAAQLFDIEMEIVRTLAQAKKYDDALTRISALFERPEAVTHLDSVLNQVAVMSEDEAYLDKLLSLSERFRSTLTDQTMVQQVDLTRASLLQKTGRNEESLKLLQELVNSGTAPDRVVRQALISSAEIYMRLQQPDKAAQMYRQLHDRFPDQSQDLMFARITEGQIISGQDRLSEAEKIFREVIAQATDDLPRNAAKLALANLLIRMHRFDESQKLLDGMIHDLPAGDRQHNEATIMLASLFRQQDRPKDAIAVLEPLIKRDIDGNSISLARRELVASYRMTNRIKDAIKLIKLEIDSGTDANQKMFDLQTYADLLIADNNLPAALTALDQAAASQTGDDAFRMQQRICDVLKNAGRLDDAAVRLKKVVAEAGNNVPVKLWALIEQIDIARRRNQNDVANELLKQLAAIPVQAGQMPPNLLSITWSVNDEGNQLVRAILERVIAVESADSFVGANTRLALANKLIEIPPAPPNQTPPDLTQRLNRAEALCREVIARNTDINQIFQSYEVLGRISQQRGDMNAALAGYLEFERNIKHERVKALAALGRAITMMAWSKRDEALTYYKQAQAVCMDNMDCCRIASERAEQLVAAGRAAEAREVYLYVRDKLPNCWGYEKALKFLEQR